VVSVSAVDSTGSFPGAELHLGSTTIPAINANGADLPAGDLSVVVLTGSHELGCSVADFTAAGIAPGKNQIAVVSRGTCARAAKAIYGQQAGAAAVVMINTDTGYPPYEGQITSNPDTGAAFTVTIPFLGVRSTDGAALKAADGTTLTIVAADLTNPSFRHYASFSSSGPASGDSSVKPNVAAPGVSISSAAVGTGSDSTVMSGTSMAAPHVAGVAALTVQAHPDWRAQDIAAILGSTADPDKVVGYSPVLGGGLVDAAQSVKTSAYATGDSYRTESGRISTPSLSFGFDEPQVASVGVKILTVTNRGNRAVTYKVSSEASSDSLPATLRFSSRTVRVQPHSSARVAVSLVLRASVIGSSLGGDADYNFNFAHASGTVVLTSDASVLRVPYLLVPRAQANVVGSVSRSHSTSSTKDASNVDTARGGGTPTGPLKVKLANRFGALDADADFYTWGLSDPKDKIAGTTGTGADLRAVGVQSFDDGSDKLVVFALNNYDRFSNAASNEYLVNVDTNNDGTPDVAVVSADSGLVRAGDANGITEVFLADPATGEITGTTGFYATAPTDSSTLLFPVYAADLGVTSTTGAFTYTAGSFAAYENLDAVDGSASYNPWAKAIEDGDYVTVARNSSATLSVGVNDANLAAQKPLGVMVVVFDNRSGGREALLLGVR